MAAEFVLLPSSDALASHRHGPDKRPLALPVECGFHAQDAGLIVVGFDRVAVGLMFEAQTFGPVFEAAQHFAWMIAMPRPFICVVAVRAALGLSVFICG